MPEDKNKEKPIKKRRKRGKTEIQKKLEVLKKILKNGLNSHKAAIDEVIRQYNEYTNYDELVKMRDEYEARVKAVEEMKNQQ
jgi:hypothetical protein